MKEKNSDILKCLLPLTLCSVKEARHKRERLSFASKTHFVHGEKLAGSSSFSKPEQLAKSHFRVRTCYYTIHP